MLKPEFAGREDAGLAVGAGAPAASSQARYEAITTLLRAVERGDRSALDELFPLVYDELTVLAHRQRRAWHGDLTLNTTALVHEAYLKVVDLTHVPAESRAHFLAVAAKAMRHILCNYARDRRRLKRGGDQVHVALEPALELIGTGSDITDDETELLEILDEALRALAAGADRQAKVVECRFFGGMSVEDTAAALGVSPRTVKRDWNFARAWLRREIRQRSAAS